MKPDGRRHLPLAAALLVLWAAVAGLLRQALARTGGHLVYALDDPYIHMAIAKHMALHGVWGVTPFEFGSSTSSPLWTALLALAYRIVGVRDAVPLVLNLVLASACLPLIDARLRARVPGPARFVTLVAVVVLTPLPVIVFCGMEHPLHALATVGFAFAAMARLAAPRGQPASGASPGLLALAALLPLIRYEGLFVVLVVAALFAARGRPRDGAGLLLAAVIPVALYGGYAVGHGWFPIPNSVLVKGAPEGLAELLGRAPRNLMKSRALAGVMAVAGLLWLGAALRRRDPWRQFADVGWFYRYDAYLMVLGLTAIAWRLFPGEAAEAGSASAAARARGLVALRVGVVLLAAVLAWRRTVAFEQTPIASQNIYQQPYQMASFLARAYPGQAVAANDIGLVNYLADLHCCDLMGLATMPIARLRLVTRHRRAADVDRVVRESGARIAIAYESWFGNQYITEDRIPARWGAPVARWAIRDNVASTPPRARRWPRASKPSPPGSRTASDPARSPPTAGPSGPSTEPARCAQRGRACARLHIGKGANRRSGHGWGSKTPHRERREPMEPHGCGSRLQIGRGASRGVRPRGGRAAQAGEPVGARYGDSARLGLGADARRKRGSGSGRGTETPQARAARDGGAGRGQARPAPGWRRLGGLRAAP
ncbi:MAG: hypothetical protein E6K81_14025, partial [Candidatus Eisenbacteria bacterium]